MASRGAWKPSSGAVAPAVCSLVPTDQEPGRNLDAGAGFAVLVYLKIGYTCRRRLLQVRYSAPPLVQSGYGAVREIVPATGRALQPLRALLKIWMNGPGGLVTRAAKDEIFAGVAAMAVEAYDYSEHEAQGLVQAFTAAMITSVGKELLERGVVRTITTRYDPPSLDDKNKLP